MSGLLVKSTLIMRENLVELNDRSLSTIPILLGGAALTRTYVERDLREVYDGRLFYGRDAFEGLRTMDRLVELKRTGEEDPLFGREISERNVPRRFENKDTGAGGGPAGPLGRGGRQPAVPAALRRHAASPRASPLDDVAEYLNLTALFRNQWGFRPEERRGRRRVQGAGQGDAARAAGQGQGGRPPRAPGGLRPLRGQRRGQRPGHLEGRVAVVGVDALHASPASARSRGCASATSSARPTRARRTSPASCCAPSGRGPRRRRRRLLRGEPLPGLPVPARPERRDGRGDGRVLAPAHPRGARLRRRGRADADRAVPPAVPGRPLLVGLSRPAPISTTTPRWWSFSAGTASASR